MNKTLLATLIAGSVALTGCNELDKVVDSDGDKISSSVVSRSDDEIKTAISKKIDGSFIPFNLSTGQISLPTDFLKSSTTGLLSGVPQDGSDIRKSLASLDGWGLGSPIAISTHLKDSATLDETTLTGAVFIIDGSKGTPLTYGVDFITKVVGSSIAIVPLKPFKPATQYYLVISDKIKDSTGAKLKESLTYTTMSQSSPLKNIEAAASALLAAGENIIYSAPFKTQSIEPVMQAVMDAIATQQPKIGQVATAQQALASKSITIADSKLSSFLTGTGQSATAVAGATAKHDPLIYFGGMQLPYFLDTPTAANCGADLASKGTCDALTSHWVTDTSGTALSPANNTPLKKSDQAVQVFISIPDENNLPTGITKPANGWPVVLYVHGITSYKETGAAIAGNLAAQGLAMVAIDLPLHGSRSIDMNADGVYEISTTTSSSSTSPYKNGSSLVFGNLGALRTVRDNLRQSISDILSLRGALSFTPAYTDANSAVISALTLDPNSVTMMGVSLGSIIGTGALGASDIYDGTTITGGTDVAASALEFDAAALTVGGTQSAAVMAYSGEFGPTVRAAFEKNTAFLTAVGAKVPASSGGPLSVAQLGGLRDGDATQKATFKAIVDAAYPTFITTFVTAAQQAVDAGDAIAWAQKVKSDTPVLVTQVVGNGGTNLADQTVPNSTADKGFPLGGTTPLIATLGLTSYNTGDTTGGFVTGATLKAATQFQLGKHTSLLDPSHVEGITQDAGAAYAATVEMQTQVISFLKSNGKALQITDTNVAK